jgi:galactokinase
MAAAFYRRTGLRCGFFGSLDATCRPGTGLSSSAAFSLLVGSAFNFLFYNNGLSAEDLALMARDAENEYFGKPCGLMDQMASGVGSTVFIDFENPEKLIVEQIDCTLENTGYQLAVIDTGGSHIGLTAEYAAIPEEMCAAANVLNQPFARGISFDTFLGSVNEIRNQAGDRAALRLLHFLEENDRVRIMAGHLKRGEFSEYLGCVEASGISSCSLLQNCTSVTSSRQQGILLALALSRRICGRAVCRVHGGGFAGTVQTYVPREEFDNYCGAMERIFGTGSVIAVRIGRPGVCGLNHGGLILPREN